eukprot:225124_1
MLHAARTAARGVIKSPTPYVDYSDIGHQPFIPKIRKVDIKCLIKGYYTTCNVSTYLPDSVKDVIVQYYPKMNGTSYTWTISKIQQMNQTYKEHSLDHTLELPLEYNTEPEEVHNVAEYSEFLHSQQDSHHSDDSMPLENINNYNINNTNMVNIIEYKRATKTINISNHRTTDYRWIDIDSDAFTIGLPNKFFLKLQNQRKSHLFLKLMSFPLPDEYQSVICHIEIYIYSPHRQYSNSDIITIDNNYKSNIRYNQHHYYDYSRKKKSKSDKLETCCLKEWILNIDTDQFFWSKSMDINCNINILEII